MGTIGNFIEIRRDGKIITEFMTAQEIINLGPKEKVVEIQWLDDSHPVSFRTAYGVLAKVVPGRQFVVVNEREDDLGQSRKLSVLNSDGSRRLVLSNIQDIRGKNEPGQYCWFEPPRIDSSNVFGVVFNCGNDNTMYQLDINAIDGRIVGAYPLR